MAVYVDNMRASFGRMIMCHMIADTTEELDAMAVSIGVKVKWRQYSGTAKEHYDISLAMRAKAVKNGAKEITWRQTGLVCKSRLMAQCNKTPPALIEDILKDDPHPCGTPPPAQASLAL